MLQYCLFFHIAQPFATYSIRTNYSTLSLSAHTLAHTSASPNHNSHLTAIALHCTGICWIELRGASTRTMFLSSPQLSHYHRVHPCKACECATFENLNPATAKIKGLKWSNCRKKKTIVWQQWEQLQQNKKIGNSPRDDSDNPIAPVSLKKNAWCSLFQ